MAWFAEERRGRYKVEIAEILRTIQVEKGRTKKEIKHRLSQSVTRLVMVYVLSGSEPIQSENMNDTYAFFIRNCGTCIVISDSKGEAESSPELRTGESEGGHALPF